MKKIVPIVMVLLALAWQWLLPNQSPSKVESKSATVSMSKTPSATKTGASSADFERVLQRAFQNRQSNVQIQGHGVVSKVLPDDNQGSRHQRFIVKLGSGQTLLVAHNIDLAPKIKRLNKGDAIEFYGEYEWSEQGGVIHWTHHDPAKRHADGWLKHNGQLYQ